MKTKIDLNKKILIGSIIAVAILVLMPSTSAIQHNILKYEIENKLKSDLTENFDIEDINDLK